MFLFSHPCDCCQNHGLQSKASYKIHVKRIGVVHVCENLIRNPRICYCEFKCLAHTYEHEELCERICGDNKDNYP